jgi:hypothetical protein
MKDRFNAMILLAALAAVLLIALPASAKGPGSQDVDHLPGLQLDDAQKEALELKQADLKKKMIRLRADLAIVRVDKEMALKNRNFKAGDVEKLIRKEMDIETDMEMARLKNLEAVRALLTDEQWKEFPKHMAPMRPKHGPRFMEGKRGFVRGKCPMAGDMDKSCIAKPAGPVEEAPVETAGH